MKKDPWRLQEFEFGSIKIIYPVTYYLFIKECYIFDIYRTDLINEGDVVIDLGAGIGDFSVLASRKVGARGKIVAIEPNPDDFKLLSKNIINNKCDNVMPINKGVGSRGAQKEISFWGRRFNCQIDTLRTILSECDIQGKINFIKMDIEGYETDVISKDIDIVKDADTISIELHNANAKVDEILLQEGFVFDRINICYCIKKLIRNSLLSNSNHFLHVLLNFLMNIVVEISDRMDKTTPRAVIGTYRKDKKENDFKTI
jgi:FkbM family methyltransferase